MLENMKGDEIEVRDGIKDEEEGDLNEEEEKVDEGGVGGDCKWF